MKSRKTVLTLALIFLFSLTGILLTGCSSEKKAETSTPVQEAVDKEKIIKDAVMERYFNQLSDVSKNLIDPNALKQTLDTNPDAYYLLDIRDDNKYKTVGHIKGVNHIWWFDVGKNLDKLPKNKRIVVICNTGQSAGQVVAALRILGYDAVSLTGGMDNGWVKNGLPVEKD